MQSMRMPLTITWRLPILNIVQQQSNFKSRLSETEFQTFAGLAYNKCRHLHAPLSEPWSAEEQAQLDRFQEKVLHPSEKKMDKISTKQEKKRLDNDVSGQPVRIKRSGRIGVGVGSLDPKASKGILVRFDGGDSEFMEDREDLEIICPICNKGADRKCSKVQTGMVLWARLSGESLEGAQKVLQGNGGGCLIQPG